MDTLRFRGKCQYIGRTYDHLGTTYFRFKVVEVLEGSYENNVIVFEGSINSRQYQLFKKIKERKKLSAETDVSEIFPGQNIYVSTISKCASGVIEVKLEKTIDLFDQSIMTFVPEWKD